MHCQLAARRQALAGQEFPLDNGSRDLLADLTLERSPISGVKKKGFFRDRHDAFPSETRMFAVTDTTGLALPPRPGARALQVADAGAHILMMEERDTTTGITFGEDFFEFRKNDLRYERQLE